ncbi:MAG TPA: hypothetical protein DIT22_05530 [Thermodesulfobacterium commune]|nr:hypothetical protein [Thermodesulfobacterium commune]
MRKVRFVFELIGILLFTWISGYAADIFRPPEGYNIADPEARPIKLYCPSNEKANYRIAQWNNPVALSCWKKEKDALVARSPNLVVKIYNDGSQELDQNGKNLPCWSERLQRWNEFSAHITPNDESYIYSPTLSDMKKLIYKIKVKLKKQKFLDDHCSITQGEAFLSLVLKNNISKDVIFYKVRLSNINNRGLKLKPYWYWSKGEGEKAIEEKVKIFGFADTIETFGQEFLSVGQERLIEIDLLPRLLEILQDKRAEGLDRDPSHWYVSSAYYGQHIWGGVKLKTKWSNFRVWWE